jgi:hypothetical protein
LLFFCVLLNPYLSHSLFISLSLFIILSFAEFSLITFSCSLSLFCDQVFNFGFIHRACHFVVLGPHSLVWLWQGF